VAALAVDRRVSLRRFLNDAARYFGRYVRLFVLLVVVAGLAGAGYQFSLAETFEGLRENATTGRTAFLWRALGIVIMAAILAFVLMVFDYAKIRTVLDRRRSMFLAVISGLVFSLWRCWRTVPLFCLNLLIVGVLFAIYLVIEAQFSSATISSIIGLFVAQQVFILSRIWMRLSFFSTQLAYYQSTRRLLLPTKLVGGKP
jgi:hypothetical protein